MSKIDYYPKGLRYNPQTRSPNATGASLGFAHATEKSPELKVVGESMRDFLDKYLAESSVIEDTSAEFAKKGMTDSHWVALHRKVYDSMRRTHYQIIRKDDEYARRLGEAILSYESSPARLNKRQKRSLSAFRYRGHEIVKDAIEEGVPTIGALFAVVPKIVTRQYPELHPSQMNELAISCLPSIERFSFGIASHSKRLNEVFINAVLMNTYGVRGHAKYRSLAYDPDKFLISLEGSTPELVLAQELCPMTEEISAFPACPAAAHGTIGRTAHIFSEIIRQGNLYESAIVTVTDSFVAA